MNIDVIDLRDFYAQPLGLTARRYIGRRIRLLWPDVSGSRIVGLGYATPFLRQFQGEALMVGGLMPAAQGVARWPREGPGAVALVEETALPLPDASIDRVIIVHGVESTNALPAMLREVWRVLAPGGHLMIVAANRRGMWARTDTTPFGHGRPFSRGQLSSLLRQGMFSPTGWARALYMPPLRWAWLLKSSAALERLGALLWPGFSGVVIVEAVKEIYGVVPSQGWRLADRLNPGLVPQPVVPRDRALARRNATTGTQPARRTGWPTTRSSPG